MNVAHGISSFPSWKGLYKLNHRYGPRQQDRALGQPRSTERSWGFQLHQQHNNLQKRWRSLVRMISGWWFQTFSIFNDIWDVIRNPLTKSIIFKMVIAPPTRFIEGFWTTNNDVFLELLNHFFLDRSNSCTGHHFSVVKSHIFDVPIIDAENIKFVSHITCWLCLTITMFGGQVS